MDTNKNLPLDKLFPNRADLLKQAADDFNRDVQSTVIENQKTFSWMRVYLKDEYEIKPGDIVTMKHMPTSNELDIVFGAYNKKNLHKDSDEEVVEFTSEDDKKCLCLMVDIDEINSNPNINFIRSLFREGRFFDSNNLLIKDGEIIFTNNDKNLDFYSVDF